MNQIKEWKISKIKNKNFRFFWEGGGFEKFGSGELTNGDFVNSHVLGGFCGLEYLPDCSKILFWIVKIYFYNNLIEKMNKKFDTEKKVLTLFFGFEISDDDGSWAKSMYVVYF